MTLRLTVVDEIQLGVAVNGKVAVAVNPVLLTMQTPCVAGVIVPGLEPALPVAATGVVAVEAVEPLWVTTLYASGKDPPVNKGGMASQVAIATALGTPANFAA